MVLQLIYRVATGVFAEPSTTTNILYFFCFMFQEERLTMMSKINSILTNFHSLRISKQVFKASALWADAFYKSKCLSVCPSVSVSVCVFTFEVPFNSLFAPTSRSRMSNIFRDSESLGKSKGKKWSRIWTFLFKNWQKLPRKKKFFSLTFFTFEVPFNDLFAPTSQSRISNIFRDSESLEKSNGKKWSQIWTFLFENGQKSLRKKKNVLTFFTFEVLFNGPIFLEIRSPWGKVMERSGLTFEHFCLEVV